MNTENSQNATEQNGAKTKAWDKKRITAVLVLADGTVVEGYGSGAQGIAEAEICFNTAITGYQEVLTDPSYAEQIVTFTFPHIGNIGCNDEDIETLNIESNSGAVGAVFKATITAPSNYRSTNHFDKWLVSRNIIAISGIDTRALTTLIREKGMANAVIAHNKEGKFDLDALKKRASKWHGLEGLDLAKTVSSTQTSTWNQTPWEWDKSFGERPEDGVGENAFHVVVVDFGIKRNILRLLAGLNCKLTILPATATAQEIKSHNPDGIFLSNGPGDPAATGKYSVDAIRGAIESGKPVFGICLGHQMLALALGAKTVKMHQGHHGANHPVMDHTTGKVEIVSMNHGFAVDSSSLPDGVEQTHISLFDNTNCGLAVKGKPIFSVQHHPEASPGPQDSHYLFQRFVNLMRVEKGLEKVPERA